MSPIAIVGIGCRFAGAADPIAYWRQALAGAHAFGRVPPDRWDHDAFFDANKRATDRSYAPTGAFIDDVRTFPALHFGIPPRRVEVMDPQQRLAIEVALEAIADAGCRPSEMPHRTGVVLGVTATEYRLLLSSRITAQLMAGGQLGEAPDPQAIASAVGRVAPSRPFTAAGLLANMTAAAVAQELDLHGPAWTTDAACASALVAVHSAVAQLRSGALDAVLAGGIYLCLTPENHVAFSRIGAISASGVCRPFDMRADGFVQGDGAGIVVLKRLEDARANGDRIYAVLHGIAMNNDGAGDGPMAPLAKGQVEVLDAAWRDAGVAKNRLGYIEAHGTGTDVGDEVELAALLQVFGDQAGPVPLGSSKANVGHTMSAAGVAGLVRASLALHHRTVPPLAGFASARPERSFGPITLPQAPQPLKGDVASVSSFGFGGTNAHVVLAAEAPVAVAEDGLVHLVTFSAGDAASRARFAAELRDAVAADPNLTPARMARTLAVRPATEARAAVRASSRAELLAGLDAVARGASSPGTFVGEALAAPRIGFLFPGQGSQRVGMLRDIAVRVPAVAQALAAWETPSNLPLRDLMWSNAPGAANCLRATEHCQPVLLGAGLALARMLGTVGVVPVAAAGHSLGEFAAAAMGGLLSDEAAMAFAAGRGRAMAAVAGDQGKMVAAKAGAAAVTSHLVDGAVIANDNHPNQVVISGFGPAVDAVAASLAAAGIEVVALDVSHAFHSPVFADLDVSALVDAIAFAEPTGIIVASGIASSPLTTSEAAKAVFRRHARSPVHFRGALLQMRDAGVDLLVQVGAGGPLASFARSTVPEIPVLQLASNDDGDRGASLLDGLARLWVAGAPIDVRAVVPNVPPATLPPTPLPRESYWGVFETTQLALKVSGTRTVPSTTVVATPVADAPSPSTGADPVYEGVAAVVAKVSSYPRGSLRPDQTLLDDLGFDSLMVADLATGLADAFPGLGGLPQELFLRKPSVRDLADHVRSAAGGAPTATDDDLPLAAFRPVWVPAPHRGTVAAAGRRYEIRGHAHLSDAFRRLAATKGTGDLLVWVDGTSGPSPAAVVAGEAAAPDPLTPFLEALGGSPRDVLVALDAANPWAPMLAGAVKALARDWPTHRVRAVTFDGPVDATALASEWLSEDHTPSVAYRAGVRLVPGFAPDSTVSSSPGSDDIVAISGGTRGLGARLAAGLVARGASVLLIGRGQPDEVAAGLIAGGSAQLIVADVLDRPTLAAQLQGRGVTGVVHAAGTLADGPHDKVDAAAARLARQVKVDGLAHLLGCTGPTLRWATAIGSWAGRFGSRHQVHYAAANAALEAFTALGVPVAVGEYGPFTGSSMAKSIPGPVAAALRAEGVDFAGPDAGLAALIDDCGRSGPVTRGRRLPDTTRRARATLTLDADTLPFLRDHAVDGTPILPLASATDLLAWVAARPVPYEIVDLKLFTGIAVDRPTEVEVEIDGERGEIRANGRLAYRARIRPTADVPNPAPTPAEGEPTLPLAAFYATATFHGPLLQGLRSLDAADARGASGTVVGNLPSQWGFGDRDRWAVDPLALDSAFQLAAYVGWTTWQRAGLPVGFRRLVLRAPVPAGTPLRAELTAGPRDGDRFEGDVVIRDADGSVLLTVEGAAAELRQASDDPSFDPVTVDIASWPEVADLDQRLAMAAAVGIRNPYFAVHEGTARNTTVVGGRTLVNFSSYNYLGLSGDPRVLDAVDAAVRRYGTSVSASRVASGERPFHVDLERELAAAQGAEDAVVFTAGHATNVTAIGHLLGPGDLVLHDELIHDSALQGIKLSGAGRRSFRHDDPGHAEQLLRELRGHHRRVLIVVEGVYSMDGDLCALPEYVRIKERYGALLMVDEAHSFGIVGASGRGIAEHHGIDGGRIDLWMGTLSKSLASCGGWIAGRSALVRYLRYTAPGFVYSAGLTPANGVAALTSLRLMLEEPWRVARLQANAARFHDALVARGVDTGPARGGSGVVPAVTGNSLHALMLSQRLNDQGINVQPIVYPAVADDAARLRFFLSSTHTDAELDAAAAAVATTLATLREEFPALS